MTLPQTREGWIKYFADTLPSERVSKAIDCLLSVQAPLAELVACREWYCDKKWLLTPEGAERDYQERGQINARERRALAAARAALNAKESP